MGEKVIGPTFIMEQGLVNLAYPFPCQGDSGFIKLDPTLLLHLFDERLIRCIDTIVASKVVPLNVVGAAEVKVSTQGCLRLLQLEDSRLTDQSLQPGSLP